MPKPKAGETKENYISRCIPIVMDEGTAKDNKQASAICYSMWERHTEKSQLSEFSLVIRSVGLNKKTGERYWKASTSDIFPDSYNDEMSFDLYKSFISKIKKNVKPPEEFRSESWDGGMPYVSVAHYREHSIAGDSDKIYVDGAILKANGTFRDNPIGRACFDSLCDDLYGKDQDKDKVRVSIAFLDYKHQHKSNGFIFERSEVDDICPECAIERAEGKYHGRIFLDGLLIHFAMTRVPVNKRTLMEVDKSMTTKKDDAASIVGEELADELENKEKSLVGKSETLVVKADETELAVYSDKKEEEKDEEEMTEEEKKKKKEEQKSEVVEKCEPAMADSYSKPYGGAITLSGVKEWMIARKEDMRIGDLWYAFQSVLGNINSTEDMPVDEKAKAISKVADEFKTMVKDKSAAIYESLVSLSLGEVPDEVKTQPTVHTYEDMLAKFDALEKLIGEALTLSKSPVQPISTEAHPLEAAVTQLRADYDSVILMEGTTDDKLRALQPAFEVFVQEIRTLLTVPETKSEVVVVDETNKQVLALIQALSDKVDLLSSQQKSMVAAPAASGRPAPRSINPNLVPQEHLTVQKAPAPTSDNPVPKLRALIDKSVGLGQ